MRAPAPLRPKPRLPRRVLGALALACCLPGIAHAQQAGTTRLRLSDSATVRRDPDSLAATLRAEARHGEAGVAQARVNRAVAGALDLARGVAGVTAAAGRPSAFRPEPGREWVATQAITLQGADGAAVLDLAGQLQQRGLALTGLSWRLEDGSARAAWEDAAREAIRRIHARAALLAEELGLRVVALGAIAFDAPLDAPVVMMDAAPARAMAAPPQFTREEVAITARVTADVILGPR